MEYRLLLIMKKWRHEEWSNGTLTLGPLCAVTSWHQILCAYLGLGFIFHM